MILQLIRYIKPKIDAHPLHRDLCSVGIRGGRRPARGVPTASDQKATRVRCAAISHAQERPKGV